VGQPYIEIEIDRRAIARYGLTVRAVQDVIEVALGGVTLTTTVEGRQRFPVRVRYLREMRDRLEMLGRVLVSGPNGAQVPLMEVGEIRYVRGPMAIRSEDTFLTGYVLFDKQSEVPEVDAVEAARDYLDAKLAEFDGAYQARAKELNRDLTPEEREVLPGLNLRGCEKPVFAGTYENQVRASKRLMIVIPLTLLLIFLLIYLEFRSFPVTVFVFSSVAVAMSGAFILLWLYGQPWFLDVSLFGANLRDMFQVHPINLSVAVWVGFIALFGVAEDDSVIMATYLNQRFAADQPASVEAIREAVLESGLRRIRPCLMTTATTVLGMLPLLTSQGRGADVMIPMAIPSIGGMTMQLLSLFIMPTLYCWMKERQLRRGPNISPAGANGGDRGP
jgi:Cu(I)/Ag(I) efflux system membrane protein CusA/SilA